MIGKRRDIDLGPTNRTPSSYPMAERSTSIPSAKSAIALIPTRLGPSSRSPGADRLDESETGELYLNLPKKLKTSLAHFKQKQALGKKHRVPRVGKNRLAMNWRKWSPAECLAERHNDPELDKSDKKREASIMTAVQRSEHANKKQLIPIYWVWI